MQESARSECLTDDGFFSFVPSFPATGDGRCFSVETEIKTVTLNFPVFLCDAHRSRLELGTAWEWHREGGGHWAVTVPW